MPRQMHEGMHINALANCAYRDHSPPQAMLIQPCTISAPEASEGRSGASEGGRRFTQVGILQCALLGMTCVTSNLVIGVPVGVLGDACCCWLALTWGTCRHGFLCSTQCAAAVLLAPTAGLFRLCSDLPNTRHRLACAHPPPTLSFSGAPLKCCGRDGTLHRVPDLANCTHVTSCRHEGTVRIV